MEDAHESVGEGAQRLVMGLGAGSQLLVVAACAGGVGERGEGAEVAGVGEPSVPCHPGEDHFSSA